MRGADQASADTGSARVPVATECGGMFPTVSAFTSGAAPSVSIPAATAKLPVFNFVLRDMGFPPSRALFCSAGRRTDGGARQPASADADRTPGLSPPDDAPGGTAGAAGAVSAGARLVFADGLAARPQVPGGPEPARREQQQRPAQRLRACAEGGCKPVAQAPDDPRRQHE